MMIRSYHHIIIRARHHMVEVILGHKSSPKTVRTTFTPLPKVMVKKKKLQVMIFDEESACDVQNCAAPPKRPVFQNVGKNVTAIKIAPRGGLGGHCSCSNKVWGSGDPLRKICRRAAGEATRTTQKPHRAGSGWAPRKLFRQTAGTNKKKFAWCCSFQYFN